VTHQTPKTLKMAPTKKNKLEHKQNKKKTGKTSEKINISPNKEIRTQKYTVLSNYSYSIFLHFMPVQKK